MRSAKTGRSRFAGGAVAVVEAAAVAMAGASVMLSVADALEAAAVGGGACSTSLKGDKGGKRAERQPEQERQPEKASGSDGIEPGTLGKGWTMVRVKPAYLELLVLLVMRLLLLRLKHLGLLMHLLLMHSKPTPLMLMLVRPP